MAERKQRMKKSLESLGVLRKRMEKRETRETLRMMMATDMLTLLHGWFGGML